MDDLISEFISETAESLTVLDAELGKLDRNPGDKEILGTIYRLVHTIKGTCGFLDLRRLETVAEAVENVLAGVHNGQITMTEDINKVLLGALSCIRHIVDHLSEEETEPEGSDDELIAHLKSIAQVKAPARPKKKAEPESKPQAESKPQTIIEVPAELVAAEKELPHAEELPVEKPEVVQVEAPQVAAAPVQRPQPEKIIEFAPAPPLTLPPLMMHHPVPARVEPKPEPVAEKLVVPAPVSRPLLEKIASALNELIHARNQLKASGATAGPSARLNNATRILKEILHVVEKETAQPSPLKALSVLISYAAGKALALPQRYIMEVVDLSTDRHVRIETINNTEVLLLGKRVIPIVKLRKLMQLSEFPSMREDQIVVMRVGEAEFGLVVERIGDLMEVVLEKLPKLAQSLAVYKGAALLDEKRLVMVMDAAGLARAVGFRQVRDIPPQLAAPIRQDNNLKGFLLFRAGTGAPKALLLDQVRRVDEMASHTPAIRITTLPGTALPTQNYEVVVLATEGEPTGIAVDKVLDVVHAPYALDRTTANAAFLGTVQLKGMDTELVNIANLVSHRFLEAAA